MTVRQHGLLLAIIPQLTFIIIHLIKLICYNYYVIITNMLYRGCLLRLGIMLRVLVPAVLVVIAAIHVRLVIAIAQTSSSVGRRAAWFNLGRPCSWSS